MEEHFNQLGLSRQPIFDRNLNVVAYELLYQSQNGNKVEKFLNGDQEACDVLINNFTSIYDSGSLKSLPAFLNVTEGFIKTESLPSLSRHNLVIEIQNDQSVTEELLASLRKYADAGYRIVLDDFTYHSDYNELLEIAHVVKIDISKYSQSEVSSQLQNIQRFKVTALAEKVENYAAYDRCHQLGFRLFQGNFLSQPTKIQGKKINLKPNHSDPPACRPAR